MFREQHGIGTGVAVSSAALTALWPEDPPAAFTAHVQPACSTGMSRKDLVSTPHTPAAAVRQGPRSKEQGNAQHQAAQERIRQSTARTADRSAQQQQQRTSPRTALHCPRCSKPYITQRKRDKHLQVCTATAVSDSTDRVTPSAASLLSAPTAETLVYQRVQLEPRELLPHARWAGCASLQSRARLSVTRRSHLPLSFFTGRHE